jgi:hypothetical protein
MPFCFRVNYKKKATFFKVKNITLKYTNFSCADATKPFYKSKLTRCYKTKELEWKNTSMKKIITFSSIHT